MEFADVKPRSQDPATNLVREFEAMFGVETIERCLHSSYDHFAERAT